MHVIFFRAFESLLSITAVMKRSADWGKFKEETSQIAKVKTSLFIFFRSVILQAPKTVFKYKNAGLSISSLTLISFIFTIFY